MIIFIRLKNKEIKDRKSQKKANLRMNLNTGENRDNQGLRNHKNIIQAIQFLRKVKQSIIKRNIKEIKFMVMAYLWNIMKTPLIKSGKNI